MRLRHLFLLAGLVAAMPATAAHFDIIVTNPTGVGLNDNSAPVPGAGMNGGATLGQQRLRVLQRAAEIWGSMLDSPVPIRVEASMVELSCAEGDTILGLGGPLYMYADFPNAPRSGTAYPAALANALAGRDIDPGRNDIRIQLNISVDAGCMSGYSGWWYGLDPQEVPPADRYPLLPVVMHELGHGLGFLSAVDTDTGDFWSSFPDVWSYYLYDLQIGRHWRSMTAAQRVTSARNDPHLVWTGEHVNRQLPNWLLGHLGVDLFGLRRGPLRLESVATAEFGPEVLEDGPEALVVAVNDGVAAAGDSPGTVTDGCEYPFANGHRLAGRIALIDRGLCLFVEKARHAQRHGAVAVLIANNVDGPPPGMAGTAPDVTIPVLGISRDEGALLRRTAPGQLRARPGRTETLSATREGCMRMYAPATPRSGSSVSHFHSEATPSLLMEPGVDQRLGGQVDLTLELFRDLGWPVRVGSPPPAENTCTRAPLP